MTISSCIFHPSRKPNCSGFMDLDKTTLILQEIILAIILYIPLHSEIGLKSLNDEGLSIFGIKAMKVSLKGANNIPFRRASLTTQRRSLPKILKDL
jgi:hypothetical protein